MQPLSSVLYSLSPLMAIAKTGTESSSVTTALTGRRSAAVASIRMAGIRSTKCAAMAATSAAIVISKRKR